jgi:hypothetical protein
MLDTSNNIDIRIELPDVLSSYLLGWQPFSECAEWISSIDWEKVDLNSKLAQKLGELDVLCTEVREGIRPESDFERKASEIVASMTCITYSINRPEILASSSSSNVVVESLVSPFWSRSLQEEPV